MEVSVVGYPGVDKVDTNKHLSIAGDTSLASRLPGKLTDSMGVDVNDWEGTEVSVLLTRYVTDETGDGHSSVCELSGCNVLGVITLQTGVGRGKVSGHASEEQLVLEAETPSCE